jgi:hypothetical protein
MELVLPTHRLLTSSSPPEPKVELLWRSEIEADRLTEVELELMGPILPELVSELMMIQVRTAE